LFLLPPLKPKLHGWESSWPINYRQYLGPKIRRKEGRNKIYVRAVEKSTKKR
jgi:hypothetical protein